jgi:hypothetical protein
MDEQVSATRALQVPVSNMRGCSQRRTGNFRPSFGHSQYRRFCPEADVRSGAVVANISG